MLSFETGCPKLAQCRFGDTIVLVLKLGKTQRRDSKLGRWWSGGGPTYIMNKFINIIFMNVCIYSTRLTHSCIFVGVCMTFSWSLGKWCSKNAPSFAYFYFIYKHIKYKFSLIAIMTTMGNMDNARTAKYTYLEWYIIIHHSFLFYWNTIQKWLWSTFPQYNYRISRFISTLSV